MGVEVAAVSNCNNQRNSIGANAVSNSFDPLLIVAAEAQLVVAKLRRYSRGVNQNAKKQDAWLMQAFKELRNQPSWGSKSTSPIERTILVHPFLRVLRSDECSTVVTRTALTALQKILAHGILDPTAPKTAEAIRMTVDGVLSCKIEQTESGVDEIALLKIMQVLSSILTDQVGSLLPNSQVESVIQTMIKVSLESRFSDLLRRSVDALLVTTIRAIFLRLIQIHTTQYQSMETISCDQYSEGLTPVSATHALTPCSEMSIEDATPTESAMAGEGYGVSCIEIIFDMISDLIDIDDIESRVLGLELISTAVETAGSSLGAFVGLRNRVRCKTFKLLFRNSYTEDSSILSRVLSICTSLIHHMTSCLRLPIQLLFSQVYLRILEDSSLAPDLREVAMESLVDIVRHHNTMPQLYCNFDVEPAADNIFDRVFRFLCRAIFNGGSQQLTNLQLLAFDALLVVLQNMTRGRHSKQISSEEQQIAKKIKEKKETKKQLQLGAEHFNRDPQHGFTMLQGVHLLPSPLDAKSVAAFFRSTPSLDKVAVGEFLGDADKFNMEVMQEYAKLFDYRQVHSIEAGLRTFLSTFFIPGEAQKIDRILGAFSKEFFTQTPSFLANETAAHVLCFSILMLNTDLHSSHVKVKMSEEQFVKNLRDMNNGQNFPREALLEIYTSIQAEEIRLLGGEGGPQPSVTSDHFYSDLIAKDDSKGGLFIVETSNLVHIEMFSGVWGPALSALAVIIETSDDVHVLRDAIGGLYCCAAIAAEKKIEAVFDGMITLLTKLTQIQVTRQLQVAMTLGRDRKAQMALMTLFDIVCIYGDHIREGWRRVFDIILILYRAGLLDPWEFVPAYPPASPTPHEKRGGSIAVQKAAAQAAAIAAPRVKSQQSATGKAEMQMALEDARFCANNCKIEQFLSTTSSLGEASLHFLLRALTAVAAKKESPMSGASTMSSGLASPVADRPSSLNTAVSTPTVAGTPSAPSFGSTPMAAATCSRSEGDLAVFTVDLIHSVALQNAHRIELVWPVVIQHFSAIFHEVSMASSLVNCAAIALIELGGRLMGNRAVVTSMQRDLDLIMQLSPGVFAAIAPGVANALHHVLKENAHLVRCTSTWATIFSLLELLASHPQATNTGFETILVLTHDQNIVIPPIYLPVLSALATYASSRHLSLPMALQAIEIMCKVFSRSLQQSMTSSPFKAPPEVWLPLLHIFRRLCLDPRSRIRDESMLAMQRTLLCPTLTTLPSECWRQTFSQILFPLLTGLLSDPEFAKEGPAGEAVDRTRLRAWLLTTKVFLRNINVLLSLSDFRTMWMEYLGQVESYIRSQRTEVIGETVPSMLKDIMKALLATPVLAGADQGNSSALGNALWSQTWALIDKFMPSFRIYYSTDGITAAEALDAMHKQQQKDQQNRTVRPPQPPQPPSN